MQTGWVEKIASSQNVVKLDDNGVLSGSGRSGCGSRKEEESRRRRVHNPGALHPQSGLQSLRRTGALTYDHKKAHCAVKHDPIRGLAPLSDSRSERKATTQQ
jgi:hypothetical protein